MHAREHELARGLGVAVAHRGKHLRQGHGGRRRCVLPDRGRLQERGGHGGPQIRCGQGFAGGLAPFGAHGPAGLRAGGRRGEIQRKKIQRELKQTGHAKQCRCRTRWCEPLFQPVARLKWWSSGGQAGGKRGSILAPIQFKSEGAQRSPRRLPAWSGTAASGG